MKSLVGGIVCTALLAAGPALAQSDYGFVIHMQETTDFISCTAPGSPSQASLTCGDIVEVGNLAVQQKAWIIAYGWNSVPGFPTARGLGGVEFGMEWPPTVQVLLWKLCTDGLESPDSGWPASGLGTAVTWATPQLQASGFAVVGYLVIAPGSEGRMTIRPHLSALPAPAVKFASAYPNPQEFIIPGAGYSSADIGGTNPDDGRKSCSEPVPVQETSWGRIKSTYGD